MSDLSINAVVSNLILKYVIEPGFEDLANKIRSNAWCVLENLPDSEESNEDGQVMCEIVYVSSTDAIVRECYRHSEPFNPGVKQYNIHLSRWDEFFVHFHVDFYNFSEGGIPVTTRVGKIIVIDV